MGKSPKSKKGWLFFGIGLVAALVVGWVGFPHGIHRSKAQPVSFSHKKHGADASLSCEDCHTFRADGSFAGIPPLAKCLECHETPVSGTKAETDFLEQAKRWKQEGKNIPWLIYSKQPANVFFSHAAHVKSAQIPCQECHRSVGGQTEKNPPYRYRWISGYAPEVMRMKDCEQCHAKKGTRNDCFVCHK